jgi:hypothetical protein
VVYIVTTGLYRDNRGSISREGLRKATTSSVMIDGILARVQSEHLLNTSLDHYHYTNLLGEPV